MFKCLIFLQELTARKDADHIYPHILTKIEKDQKLTLQAVAEECLRVINLRHDTDKTEENDCSQIHMCWPEIDQRKEKWTSKPNACFGCSGLHFKSNCPFKNYKCSECEKIGHKSSHCTAKKILERMQYKQRF